jgi:hypothetical protein
MDSDNLVGLGMIIMVLSTISFLVGLFMAIFSKKDRKTGVNLLIGSIVFFIIGFGTCAANFSLHGMH